MVPLNARIDRAAGIRGDAPVAAEAEISAALPLMVGQSIVVLDETFMSVFGDLVGASQAMQAIFRLIPDVAETDVPVLITGCAACSLHNTTSRLWATAGRTS